MHFSVLVVGADPEKQLAPYELFEATGKRTEYVQDVDITEETRRAYAEQGPTAPLVPFVGFAAAYTGGRRLRVGKHPRLSGTHKYGWIECADNSRDPEVLRVVQCTNPNARWDYYTPPGILSRWPRFFPIRPEAQSRYALLGNPVAAQSQCYWGDVDVEYARKKAARKARPAFRTWAAAIDGHPEPKPRGHFIAQSTHGGFARCTISETPETYWGQPALQAYKRAEEAFHSSPVTYFGFDETAYIAREVLGALVPHALVRNGEWLSREDGPGWVPHGSPGELAWRQQVSDILGGLPPGTLVTIIDCHI